MTQNEDSQVKKIEKELLQLENELQIHYRDMGKCLLEMAEHEQKTVNKLVDEIITLRRQLSICKQEIQCSACMTVNPPDALYCKRCGKKLQSKERMHRNEG